MARLLGSVRARITLLAAGLVLLVLVGVAALLVASQRDALVDQLDERVELEAEQLAGAARRGSVSIPDDDDRPVVVVVDGAVVASNVEAGAAAELVAAGDGTATIDGERVRVGREEDGGVAVVVAASLEDVDETVAGLVGTLLIVVPAATLLLAAVVWLLVGRTLRPVERIRSEVERIRLDELGRRVPEPGGRDEIARLARTMNEMLLRLDDAHQRQQRFVADASHELRTPLTRMRTELEVAGAGGGEPGVILDEVVALQAMIDDLLVLARRDAGAGPAAALVDVDDLVLEEARAAGGIDVSAVSAAQVRGDPAALRRVVRNLLDNARRHASTRVAVAVTEDERQAVVTVDDDGPGIPADQRTAVFERFSRVDDARAAGAGGTGLGLAIVQAIVADLGGVVSAGDSPLGGARLQVVLPRGRQEAVSTP